MPATVASAVKQLRNRGVTFTTVHGNQAIMEAAAAAKAAPPADEKPKKAARKTKAGAGAK